MITIDGAHGEGGGQVLRTSLTLAALTGQAVHIKRIRAGRRKPGLAPQQLTALRAAAAICGADVQGDELESQEIVFRPSHPAQAGDYVFDVSQTPQGGSAGALSLILQTILLPLCQTRGESQITLRGGTHVAWSPPFFYLEHVYLPTLSVSVEIKLAQWGFYPVGGGEIVVGIQGQGDQHRLQPINRVKRGRLQRVWGTAVVSNLPAHIPQRMANRAGNVLAENGIKADVQALRVRSAGPGAGIFMCAAYQGEVTAGFTAFGRKGLPAERVAEAACQALLDFESSGAPVDRYLADQLLVPLAWAEGTSTFVTEQISKHLTTNAWVIEQFGQARIQIARHTNTVVVQPVI